jgi:phosphoglycolate phosphatase-like HAD superfamily hydrolase
MGHDAYIVDIDGTLADLSHRLHFIQDEPKNWDAFFEWCEGDKPIWNVIRVIQCLGKENEIIYVTGRPEKVRVKTFMWLNRHNLPTGRIIMRTDGDHRADTEAKKELVDALLLEGYKVVGIFEDRPSVCRIWRSMGFTVFQMTDKEF